MKKLLQDLVLKAIAKLKQKKLIGEDLVVTDVIIEYVREKQFGDYATAIAMTLAKVAKCNPHQLAENIVKHLPSHASVTKVEVAGPGFINFFINDAALYTIVPTILSSAEKFGCSTVGAHRHVNVEFVSSNPTGPLHVGHGRSAAFGAVCSNLLEAIGVHVHREYYVNDAGRQMDILATSIWLRYLILYGEMFTFPSNGYKGDYVNDIAETLRNQFGDTLYQPINTVFANVPADETSQEPGDKEAHIDALIANAKQLLGEASYSAVYQSGLTVILDDIRDDLAGFWCEI